MPNVSLPRGARFLSLPQIQHTGGTGTIADVNIGNWNSPLQPLQPMAPANVRPRQRQTIQGENLLWQPGEEQYGFWVVREFADTCELFRAVLDTILDRVCSMEWELRLIAKPGEKKFDLEARQQTDPRIPALTAFWKKPDGVWPFKIWIRQFLEDSFVIDAACIYKERDLKGRIASLHVIDGATIARKVTEQGFLPPPPSVAFQQVLWGTIWCNLTTNDLTYVMRNPRTWKRYGFSIAEQCLTHIATSIRQQAFMLDYFTDGNMPQALCFLPSDLPIDKVREVQNYIDATLAGDLSKRRRLTFLPGYGSGKQDSKPNIIFPKEVLLKDPLMEWMFQLFCYKFGTSPQTMMKMMNRATANQAADTAEQEGDIPKGQEVADTINDIMQNDMGFDDVEFAYKQRRETDPLKSAQADDIRVGKIFTVNEIRKELGKDPRQEKEADMLGEYTPNGFVPLDASAQADRVGQLTQAKTDASPEPVAPVIAAPGKKKPGAAGSSKKKVFKRVGETIKAEALTTDSAKAKGKIESLILKVFRRQKDKAILSVKQFTKALSSAPGSRSTKLSSQLGSLSSNTFLKAQTPDQIADAIYAALEAEWKSLPAQVAPQLKTSRVSGVGKGMLQLDYTDSTLIAEANTIAEAFARDRAAEMVGMRYNDDGELVQNPNAEWAISDTTRNKIRTVVADAFKKETDIHVAMQAIEDALEADESSIFSDQRAEMIARTEVSNAQVQGNFQVWKESGIVTKVQWLISEDHKGEDECDDNDGIEVKLGHMFPSGDLMPPAHPNCQCSIVVSEVADQPDAE